MSSVRTLPPEGCADSQPVLTARKDGQVDTHSFHRETH